MTHIVREVLSPGEYIFKVYTLNGSLLYHGRSESAAIAIRKKEEKNAAATPSNDGKRTTRL